MSKGICTINECPGPVYARSWCKRHYSRWTRHGDPTYTAWDPVRRFESQTAPAGDCIVWTGYVSEHGYASFLNAGNRILVHRFSYEMHNGPIPEGMEIDHTCHNRACVKPQHLRLATGKQNNENLRGASSRSKTGIRGVTRDRGMWRATVGHNGRTITVGRFHDIDDAEAAAIAKRNQLFTHNDHDRRARV